MILPGFLLEVEMPIYALDLLLMLVPVTTLFLALPVLLMRFF